SEHADRAQVSEHEESKQPPEGLAEREHAGREGGDPPDEADPPARDAKNMGRAPDVDVASEGRVPGIIERRREDRDERTDPDERDAKLGAQWPPRPAPDREWGARPSP